MLISHKTLNTWCGCRIENSGETVHLFGQYGFWGGLNSVMAKEKQEAHHHRLRDLKRLWHSFTLTGSATEGGMWMFQGCGRVLHRKDKSEVLRQLEGGKIINW